jgi:predicted RNase H-like HicB family nuclease/uncharacterized protein (DUF433 family)
MTRTFTAVIHKEDDWYVADCPEVGTVSQGKSIEEAIVNLKGATELIIEEFPLKEFNRPLLTTFDISQPEHKDKKVGEQPVSYVVEENKSSLDWSFPNIEMVKFTGGTSAVIRGTRIPVHILIGYLLIGETPEIITTETIPHITLSQVYEAMRYYFVHRAEIDKEREENTEEASRRMLLEKLGEKKYKEITGAKLSAELAAWELASDEALENFEIGLKK